MQLEAQEPSTLNSTLLPKAVLGEKYANSLGVAEGGRGMQLGCRKVAGWGG